MFMCYVKNFIISDFISCCWALESFIWTPQFWKLFSDRTKWCLVSFKKYVYFRFFNVSIIHVYCIRYVYKFSTSTCKGIFIASTFSTLTDGSCCLFSIFRQLYITTEREIYSSTENWINALQFIHFKRPRILIRIGSL